MQPMEGRMHVEEGVLRIRNCCANRMQSRARSSYAEVKPAIDEVN